MIYKHLKLLTVYKQTFNGIQTYDKRLIYKHLKLVEFKTFNGCIDVEE